MKNNTDFTAPIIRKKTADCKGFPVKGRGETKNKPRAAPRTDGRKTHRLEGDGKTSPSRWKDGAIHGV